MVACARGGFGRLAESAVGLAMAISPRPQTLRPTSTAHKPQKMTQLLRY